MAGNLGRASARFAIVSSGRSVSCFALQLSPIGAPADLIGIQMASVLEIPGFLHTL